MNPVRKATPDSEAVGSSEDEKPWPSSMSFGRFPLKEGGVPGLPGGIWATRSGSFKLSDKAKMDVRANVRLGAVNHAHAGARATPSPSVSEGAGAGALPFAIPLQPVPKTGRSLSHSTGQREGGSRSSGQQLLQLQLQQQHAGATGHASLPLGLLAEEVDTESESEVGTRLTQTLSHPPMGTLMRTATLPPSFDHPRDSSDGSEYHGDLSAQPGLLRGHTFGAAFANISLDHSGRRARWQSSQGWDDVPNANESRRHSLADIPTRRGSLAAGEPSSLSRPFEHIPQESDEYQQHRTSDYQGYGLERETDHNMTRPTDSDTQFDIPAMYRVPHVALSPAERRDVEMSRERQPSGPPAWGPGASRPRKQLYVVSFKCSRVEVFYLLDNTGLRIREGDLVIVEADRGQDLGTVQHAKVSPEAARLLKKKYGVEQYKWLMMYSVNKEGGINPNAQIQNDNGSPFTNAALNSDGPSAMQGVFPGGAYHSLKPKAIKRLASDHEIKMLAEKEGNEAKAKRTCQQKVQHLRLQMEILDAEWQWDFQKLIFYYYADHYINFKDLITELYRIYKTRIWMSAINPASFSQHATGQPPSGIGPGAVAPYNHYANNQGYTMAYGEDADPYGSQMPYQIPYETYTPNFPSIPGVPNSYAPSHYGGPTGTNYAFYGQAPLQAPAALAFSPSGNHHASADATLGNRTSQMKEQYRFSVNRSGNDEHLLAGISGLMSVPENGKIQAAPSEGPFSRGFPSIKGSTHLENITSSPSPKTSGRRQHLPPIGTRTRPVFGEDVFGTPTLTDQQAPNIDPVESRPTDRSRLIFGQQAPMNDSASPEVRIEGIAELGSSAKTDNEKAEEKANKADFMLRYLNDSHVAENP